MILLFFGWVQLHELHGSLAPSGVFGVLELPTHAFGSIMICHCVYGVRIISWSSHRFESLCPVMVICLLL
jgi:hypothetical protein